MTTDGRTISRTFLASGGCRESSTGHTVRPPVVVPRCSRPPMRAPSTMALTAAVRVTPPPRVVRSGATSAAGPTRHTRLPCPFHPTSALAVLRRRARSHQPCAARWTLHPPRTRGSAHRVADSHTRGGPVRLSTSTHRASCLRWLNPRRQPDTTPVGWGCHPTVTSSHRWGSATPQRQAREARALYTRGPG